MAPPGIETDSIDSTIEALRQYVAALNGPLDNATTPDDIHQINVGIHTAADLIADLAKLTFEADSAAFQAATDRIKDENKKFQARVDDIQKYIKDVGVVADAAGQLAKLAPFVASLAA